MTPEIIPHWKRVLKHAWSVRLMGLVVLFSVLEILLPYLDNGTYPVWLFPALTGLAGAGGFIARFVIQSKIPLPPGASDASQ